MDAPNYQAFPGSGGGSPTGAAGGDLSGTYPNPSVATVGGLAAATLASLASGAQPTSQKNSANGYAGLDANTLLNAAQLPAPTTTAKGARTFGTKVFQAASGDALIAYRGVPSHPHSLTTGGAVVGTMLAGPTSGVGGKISTLFVEVTTLGIGATFDVGIYSGGTTGAGCVLLWSATGFNAGSTGVRTITIAGGAFTPAGAAYNDGAGNFILDDDVMYVGVLDLGAVATYRVTVGGQSPVVGFSSAGGATPWFNSWSQAGLASLPADLGSATQATTNPRAVMCREVST